MQQIALGKKIKW